MDDRTLGERVADDVTQFGGSWKFIIIFMVFLIAWIATNTLLIFTFDQYPYILLNLILSFIAAFQAPFIMMSQNRTEKKQDQAYRLLFKEIKELVEQDIAYEKEIEHLTKEIQKEQQIIKEQHVLLLKLLNKS